MATTNTIYQKAMADPAKVFAMPQDVVDSKDLSREEKINILKQWEYDEREREVALEENMSCDDFPDLLREVHMALRQLIEEEPQEYAPTKQGGYKNS